MMLNGKQRLQVRKRVLNLVENERGHAGVPCALATRMRDARGYRGPPGSAHRRGRRDSGGGARGFELRNAQTYHGKAPHPQKSHQRALPGSRFL